MSQFFLILSSVITISFLLVYFLQVRNGSSIPNATTWLIWAIVSTMNAISFFLVTNGNFWQSIYTLIVALGLINIFLYAVVRGKFGKIGNLEKTITLAVVLIGVLWKATGNEHIANVSLQGIFLLSIVPTIVGLVTGMLKEKGLPWYLAVSAHAFAALGIVTSGLFDWVALGYPLVTGVFGNGIVAVVVFLQNKKDQSIHAH